MNETLANISKIESIYNRAYIQSKLEKDDYTAVTVEVTDSSKIDAILASLSKDFKLEAKSRYIPSFWGYTTLEGLRKLNANPYVTQIWYGIGTAVPA